MLGRPQVRLGEIQDDERGRMAGLERSGMVAPEEVADVGGRHAQDGERVRARRVAVLALGQLVGEIKLREEVRAV